MKPMTEAFIPKLNDFTEKLKAAHFLHAENINRLGGLQKEMLQSYNELSELFKKKYDEQAYKSILSANILAREINTTKEFQEWVKEERNAFQEMLQLVNEQLGSFSSHWGGYIESLGVQYMLNTLKKHYDVHTTIQKFKRWWHKSRNVEIDLLALSDTHAYVVEVKNQLKQETFKQMLTVLEKIREKVPEYAHLKIQPVFVCVHAEEAVVKTTLMSGLWIVRYKGFDPIDPVDEFEWLRKDDEEGLSAG